MNSTIQQLLNYSFIFSYIYLFNFFFFNSQARGKSGPLFQFDATDDIRLVNDATQEKQDSHAGKVLLRYVYKLCNQQLTGK